MTTQDELISRKLALIELPKAFQIATQICKIPSISHQHFYDIKKATDSTTLRSLRKKHAANPLPLPEFLKRQPMVD